MVFVLFDAGERKFAEICLFGKKISLKTRTLVWVTLEVG
jgi:hypothetical protein